ncbi:Mlp family lipoprotein [Borrelia miyamotoi]|uniref:Mlp family lipoprotein n=1 Tax=Borrelia miyamotoi TaxID=47466 RepID=UPI0026B6E906
MKSINFVLFMLLLISSFGLYNNKNKEIENGANNGELGQQVEKQKTSEEALRERLSESQNKNLDFLKEILDGDDSKFSKFLSADDTKIKSILDHIES